ncbi:hypothetical protein FGO68_gene17048 [Halteria grandinella]|uniref:Uncharacterized protein n=1 Tax=Halteria grandinella TaxID=5974 RepID=A0A8J8NKS2_HALGN|nr:hypothetical protein FGO68_gene17048 [Halteria grandinella]
MAERLQTLLEQKNFYEYEQLTKTMFFKHKMRRRTDEMKKVIEDGIVTLGTNGQKDLVIDLLEIYYTEHAKKVNDIDDFFYKLCGFVFEHGDEARVENFFDRVIEYTRNANHDIPRMLAHRQFSQGKFSTAHINFLLCRDVDFIAKSLVEVMKQGYGEAEQDLFLARAMLELISRTEQFSLAIKLRKDYFPQVRSPIVNFVEMLPEIIQMKDFGLLKEIIGKYENEIKRDPVFMTILDKVAQKYFDGQRLIQESGLAKLLNSFLGGGK